MLRGVLRARLARLAAEADAKRRDAGFHEAVRAMARFWRYSPFNQFVIGLQRPAPERTHAQEETEAEATAWVVLDVLGLAPPSPAYIAWQGGTGDAVLRSLGRVQRATRRILEAAGIDSIPSDMEGGDARGSAQG